MGKADHGYNIQRDTTNDLIEMSLGCSHISVCSQAQAGRTQPAAALSRTVRRLVVFSLGSTHINSPLSE